MRQCFFSWQRFPKKKRNVNKARKMDGECLFRGRIRRGPFGAKGGVGWAHCIPAQCWGGGGNPSGKGGADDKFIPVTRACHSRKKPVHRREAEQQKPLVDLQETLLRDPFPPAQPKNKSVKEKWWVDNELPPSECVIALRMSMERGREHHSTPPKIETAGFFGL